MLTHRTRTVDFGNSLVHTA